MAAEKTAEKTALVIMAAGLGNRYGGLKQLEPVGANGEFIIDYSIYDALAAGCGKIVFVIRRENLAQFRDTVGRRAERAADTAYAFQELGDLPAGISIPGGLPQGRAKQWGTAHAVYCARHEAGGRDMIVVNADDFYGRGTFAALAGFLAGGRLAEADAKAETGAKAEASAKAGARAEAKAEEERLRHEEEERLRHEKEEKLRHEEARRKSQEEAAARERKQRPVHRK
ncbi:MAG: NTP transferase domain-containing protein [Clostridiales bacterium]|nr:NTP transferase domain-containing protein [Clostridiales bacterium]